MFNSRCKISNLDRADHEIIFFFGQATSLCWLNRKNRKLNQRNDPRNDKLN